MLCTGVVFRCILLFNFRETALFFWKPLLKPSFHSVEHANALFVSVSKRSVFLFCNIPFQVRHVQVVNCFRGLTATSIHAFDFIAHMSIIVLFCELSR